MDDIVEQLRNHRAATIAERKMLAAAADEIERLRWAVEQDAAGQAWTPRWVLDMRADGLLAKVLRFVVEGHDILELGSGGFTVEEIDVLRSASNRVTATVED